MTFCQIIKEIGRGAEGARSLEFSAARHLYLSMLDGGVPDLELGAIVLSLRVKGEATAEMRGFLAACYERTHRLRPPTFGPRPIVLPTYNGSRREPNLTPLLALLLQRFGVPVLVHGLIEGFGRVSTAQVFRELGYLPSSSIQQVERGLEDRRLSFAPIGLLCPGLANLLALRARLGVRNSAHSLVKMLNPYRAEGVLIAAATHPAFIDLMRDVLATQEGVALLLRGTEGEPFANPKRRPRIEYISAGGSSILFEAEHDSLRSLPLLPADNEPGTTAVWIRRVLDGQLPIPHPIANQLACCLQAAGVADDLNQAKALVAVEGNFPTHL